MKKWEVLATKQITNTMGIQLVYMDNDVIKFRKVTIDKAYKVNTSRIRCDRKGNLYFIAYGYREYISEYMRCK